MARGTGVRAPLFIPSRSRGMQNTNDRSPSVPPCAGLPIARKELCRLQTPQGNRALLELAEHKAQPGVGGRGDVVPTYFGNYMAEGL